MCVTGLVVWLVLITTMFRRSRKLKFRDKEILRISDFLLKINRFMVRREREIYNWKHHVEGGVLEKFLNCSLS